MVFLRFTCVITEIGDYICNFVVDLALLRACRSLKPLRVVTRMPSLQVLLYSVLSSIPRLKVRRY